MPLHKETPAVCGEPASLPPACHYHHPAPLRTSPQHTLYRLYCRYDILLLARPDTLLALPSCTALHCSSPAPVYHLYCRYDIFLFARPDTLLAWASLPVVKVMQIR